MVIHLNLNGCNLDIHYEQDFLNYLNTMVCRSMRPLKVIDGFPLSELNPVGNTQEISQEDLPFSLDDDCSGPDASPSFDRRSPIRSTYGFSLDAKSERKEVFKASEKIDFTSNYDSVTHKPEVTGGLEVSEGNLKEPLKSVDPRQAKCCSKGASF